MHVITYISQSLKYTQKKKQAIKVQFTLYTMIYIQLCDFHKYILQMG